MVMYQVTCPNPNCTLDSVFPDRDGAAGCVRRHHGLVGHRPDVVPVFETPHERLVF